MEIINKYLPINTKEKINEMMVELESTPYLMTPALYTEIFQNISKAKLQVYFQSFKGKFTADPNEAIKYVTKRDKASAVETKPTTPKEPTLEKKPTVEKKDTVNKEATANANAARADVPKTKIVLPMSTLGDRKYIYGTYIEMAFHNFFLTLNHIYGKVTGGDIMKERYAQIDEEKKNLEVKVRDAERNFGLIQAKYNYLRNRKTEDEMPVEYLNARNTVRNAKEKLQKKELSKNTVDFAEAALWATMFNSMENGKPEEQAKANELVRKHFPFLKPMLDVAEDKNAIKLLKDLSLVIRPLRNIFSHYKFETAEKPAIIFTEREYGVIKALKNCFDGSKREVKSRFALNDNEMKCSDRFEQYINYEEKDKYGKPKKAMREIANYPYKIDTVDKEKKHHLTEFGLLSLFSLFLEKKYIKIFADKLHIIRKQDEKVIGEMLAVYRIRLYVRKLTCSKNTDAIALDILNELQKCPKELFEMLTPEDQKKFRVEMGVSEDTTADDVLMIRHSDRFAYLLMKYIDDANLFEDLRFQVSLGNYYFKFYNKRCIDSNEADRVRSLSASVTGFGRITEIEEARRNVWHEMIREHEDVHKNTDEEKPYITDHHANYVFNGNRIAMWIPEDGQRMFIPELADDGVRNMSPTCWMSIYEMPALAFNLLLNGASSVENVIKASVQRYKKLFNDIKEGKLVPQASEEQLCRVLKANYNGIQLSDIPKKLQAYLLGVDVDINTEYQHWAEDIITRMIDGTKRRLEHFKEDVKTAGNHKMNKIGKKRYVEIKPGKLAEYLARDIMLFQPQGEDNKNKLTGLNFQILQASMATYNDGNYERLKRIFTSAHLIGNADERLNNPIIAKVCKQKSPASINDLYTSYLNEKIYYLNQCLKAPEAYRSLDFLYSNRSKWQERTEEFYRALAGRYLKDEYCGTEFDKSLELPRGLFDESIRTKLSTLSPALKALACDTSKNITYLIYAYFKQIASDEAQAFYAYKRNYRLFDKLWKMNPRSPKEYRTPEEIYRLINKINGKRAVDTEIKSRLGSVKLGFKEKVSLDEKKAAEKASLLNALKVLKDTETTLKRYKIQDMMLFLIAKSILLDENRGESKTMQGSAIANMKLHNITDGKVLSQTIPFSVTVNSLEGEKKTIRQDNLKLKNYSQFFRFLYDRRIPSLLTLVSSEDILREELEKEFEIYDKVHPGIFKEVFDREKEYYTEHPDKKEQKFIEIISTDGHLSQADLRILAGIRNSFAHAVYTTEVEKAKLIDLPNKAEIISQIFTDYLKRKTE